LSQRSSRCTGFFALEVVEVDGGPKGTDAVLDDGQLVADDGQLLGPVGVGLLALHLRHQPQRGPIATEPHPADDLERRDLGQRQKARAVVGLLLNDEQLRPALLGRAEEVAHQDRLARNHWALLERRSARGTAGGRRHREALAPALAVDEEHVGAAALVRRRGDRPEVAAVLAAGEQHPPGGVRLGAEQQPRLRLGRLAVAGRRSLLDEVAGLAALGLVHEATQLPAPPCPAGRRLRRLPP
jgi:hypothetical protein